MGEEGGEEQARLFAQRYAVRELAPPHAQGGRRARAGAKYPGPAPPDHRRRFRVRQCKSPRFRHRSVLPFPPSFLSDLLLAANHFIEWQADYHHPTLSHSLIAHAPYPSLAERTRFLRAYIGCDSGIDSDTLEPLAEEEDPRVELLENEVRVWEPSSHAMWAVWGVVQAKEDLLAKVGKWRKECERRSAVESRLEGMGLVEEKGEEEGADFDYLAYALGRITLFREELKALGITE